MGVRNEILLRQKGSPSIAMTGWKYERSAGSDPLEFGGLEINVMRESVYNFS